MLLPRTDSGLYVAAEASDEVAVRRALKDHDPDLRLVPQLSDHYGTKVYKVFRSNGPERRADFLFQWGDDYGNPWPLSMQIVEKVKSLDKNNRTDYVDPDEHNARIKAERVKDYQEHAEDIKRGELNRKGRIYTFHRGQYLRRARDKQRRKGHNV